MRCTFRQPARSYRRENTVWTDGSRLENKRVGAVFVWKLIRTSLPPRHERDLRRRGLRHLPGAPLDRGHQETGGRLTIFVDSTAAIERVRTDSLGPMVAIEVCDLIFARGDQVTIGWVPSHLGIEGNEMADDTPRRRLAARPRSGTTLPPGSLSTRPHYRRWPESPPGPDPGHGGEDLRQRPRRASVQAPPERSLRRQHLRNTRKELAGRFYQFHLGHANIGSYLHRVGTIDDDRSWHCDTGERQTLLHLIARCPAWRGQA